MVCFEQKIKLLLELKYTWWIPGVVFLITNFLSQLSAAVLQPLPTTSNDAMTDESLPSKRQKREKKGTGISKLNVDEWILIFEIVRACAIKTANLKPMLTFESSFVMKTHGFYPAFA